MPTSHDPSLPPLARGGIDRSADERTDPELLERLRADPDTAVIVVRDDAARLAPGGGLARVNPAQAPAGALWAFLGRDDAGRAHLLASAPSDGDGDPSDAPAPDERWAQLRAAGGEMDAVEAGLFVEAVTLSRWLRGARFCGACGSEAEITEAGWSRRCPACGRTHFPRADPAVIVAVVSEDGDRLLLGRNALWGDRVLYSTFAGFVEAGESLEAAVVREVREEAGVDVAALAYQGSQAWPYPHSLMLGFRARAREDLAARADGVEIVDVRWFTREEIRSALRGEGEVRLPGPASIARQLITQWCGEDT